MRRIALFILPLITLFPPPADALTVRDVIELTRARLGEEIILALIEVDPSVFPIDTETMKMLKDAGVSPRVIVAMVRSGRTRPPLPDPAVIEQTPAPEPQVIVIDHHDTAVQQVPVAVPVYVPYPVTTHRTHVDDRIRNAPDPYDAARRLDLRAADDARRDVERARQPAPVYWGFGGQLRPDAWQPPPVKRDKDR